MRDISNPSLVWRRSALTLDTLVTFLFATGSGFVTMILGRGVLIYLMIRYVLKQRRLAEDVES